jgi:hypothetical protein
MFSQWNDRISSLETIVSQLQTSILELKDENTRLKEQFAQIPTAPEDKDVKSLEEEPPVEVFMSVLKRVPEKPAEQRNFFTENANSEKYYYMAFGYRPQGRNSNTLVPLGTFLGFLNYNCRGCDIPDDQYQYSKDQNHYCMRFSNALYNSIHMDVNSTNPIVYTDEPPAPESTPLHYYDYIQLTTPEWFDEHGKPKQDYPFPHCFGDGINGEGGQSVGPYFETEQLRNSRNGAANFIAKKTILKYPKK